MTSEIAAISTKPIVTRSSTGSPSRWGTGRRHPKPTIAGRRQTARWNQVSALAAEARSRAAGVDQLLVEQGTLVVVGIIVDRADGPGVLHGLAELVEEGIGLCSGLKGHGAAGVGIGFVLVEIDGRFDLSLIVLVVTLPVLGRRRVARNRGRRGACEP